MIEAKNQLRREIAKRKAKFTAEQLEEKSSSVISNLEDLKLFKNAQCVLLYYSMSDEVDTKALIDKYASSKKIILPIVTKDGLILKKYISEDNLELSKFGIKEPRGEVYEEYDKIDLVVVPGVAFDKSLNRMGRGKGYYDGLLPKLKATKVAICFDIQVVENVPVDDRDVKMDLVVSESNLF